MKRWYAELVCIFGLAASLCTVAADPETNLVRLCKLANLSDQRINESSGLAFSRRHENILWTHNDSGDGPHLFAIDTNGALRAFVVVTNADAFDWEDMTACVFEGQPYLVVADAGDNKRIRETSDIYWIEEPEIPAGGAVTVRVSVAQRIEFVFEDGPRDCEAVAVDEGERAIVLISKESSDNLPCGLYVLPIPSAPWVGKLVARRVASLHLEKVVAMDFSRDGNRAIVLTYDRAYEFQRQPGQSWVEAFKNEPAIIPIPWLSQGEAICYGPDNVTLYLTSENLPAPLWQIVRPEVTATSASAP